MRCRGFLTERAVALCLPVEQAGLVGQHDRLFNATETVLDPAYDWVRIAVAMFLGIAVAAFVRGGAHASLAEVRTEQ